MTLDDNRAFAQLDSPLLGTLWHAIKTLEAVTHGDVVAGRVYEAPEHAAAHVVDTDGLRLSPAQEAEIADWPLAPDSLFSYAVDHPVSAGVGRLGVSSGTSAAELAGLFKPFADGAPVTDCLILSFPVVMPAWCMMVFVRFGGQPGFSEDDMVALRRLRLPLVRLFKDGYRREVNLRTPQKPMPVPPPQRLSATDVLARLSRTERQVFSFLCVDATEREIGDAMNRSPHTIHVHVKNIYRKLGISSRRQLAAMFSDAEGLEDLDDASEVDGAPAPPAGSPVPKITVNPVVQAPEPKVQDAG